MLFRSQAKQANFNLTVQVPTSNSKKAEKMCSARKKFKMCLMDDGSDLRPVPLPCTDHNDLLHATSPPESAVGRRPPSGRDADARKDTHRHANSPALLVELTLASELLLL